MLIDTTSVAKVNDILAFKLVTGEEIVAKVLEITDSEMVIAKPMAMTIVPQNGSASVAFMPWSLGMPEDAKVRLQRHQIIAYARARQEATAGYIKHTTGLDVPGVSTLKGI